MSMTNSKCTIIKSNIFRLLKHQTNYHYFIYRLKYKHFKPTNNNGELTKRWGLSRLITWRHAEKCRAPLVDSRNINQIIQREEA